jgi:hypothetical protein
VCVGGVSNQPAGLPQQYVATQPMGGVYYQVPSFMAAQPGTACKSIIRYACQSLFVHQLSLRDGWFVGGGRCGYVVASACCVYCRSPSRWPHGTL